jgi:hypothetical protein
VVVLLVVTVWCCGLVEIAKLKGCSVEVSDEAEQHSKHMCLSLNRRET